ncbi:LysE/ArgO family amino acid transporter [Microbacterium sp. ZXX196]|uniref:LysE/ArgO family amino acid transporter n=1 Tax=Microbacterium sp. ZXX196 TaxID=2609291 RepID=UPI0012B968C8|nr:LysE family transporter [Microbacterium sp. ZXX196]MTE23157.1 amino acid transporter [Microbacterium sp. ZXX196]
MLTALLAGLALCLSLIVAPGAQNVFLLREGIRHAGSGRRHAIALALACLASDVVLIAAGVGGFGALVTSVPWIFDAARWAGVTFLAGYGALAARRALRGSAGAVVVPATTGAQDHAPATPPGFGGTATLTRPTAARSATLPAVLTCLAITWLNPHTYLDTVVMLGSISTTYGDARWAFGAGAILGSAIWFAFVVFASRYAARFMRSPRSWRVLDAAVAVLMVALAAALALA